MHLLKYRTICRETTVEWMKPRIKSTIWNIRKQKNQPIRTRRRKRIKKNEDRISSIWDNFKRSNISIIVVPEGEEKEQGTRNLSEKIVKEIFLNLVKEIDSKSRKHRESKTNGCKEAHSKTHHN